MLTNFLCCPVLLLWTWCPMGCFPNKSVLYFCPFSSSLFFFCWDYLCHAFFFFYSPLVPFTPVAVFISSGQFFTIWLKTLLKLQILRMEFVFLLQAILAVLLFKYRCSHLRSGQLRSRQNWHFKIRACCYVRGKETSMMVISGNSKYLLELMWNLIQWIKFSCEISALKTGPHNTSDWKELNMLQVFYSFVL